ncbi:hypothetical protein J5N97_007372 [Dioscorea zingiberensis]|uniref:YABBY N-terminal domain-containing protein n=1 Tax=Dioscorea zingiberensis TaxID=325984 RepID=A0A9D5DBN0_9LILI|nr:hypothetical protein J5N97_007372 [Dioscorea zingiberensis]
MSTCNPFLELQEELGYVQCSFCTTILLVSVPCSSLLKVVTVKCGHCTALLSVSLVRASFVPLQLLASLGDDELTTSTVTNLQWAQFPRFQQKGEGESCSRREGKDSKDAHGKDSK